MSVTIQRHETWSCRKITIPDIVLHRLEMPHSFSGLRFEGENAVGKERVSVTIPAIEIKGCGACGQKNESALHVETRTTPTIGSAAVFPSLLGPRLVAKLSR